MSPSLSRRILRNADLIVLSISVALFPGAYLLKYLIPAIGLNDEDYEYLGLFVWIFGAILIGVGIVLLVSMRIFFKDMTRN
jgi:hypothetical protein